ncbi:MAG TPA: hypothetical protein VG245_06320, partial [Candidatus Dormibacteraeota bacterium]|nr:hypothetical protein [Candidatus Dormibacteraeota bacterium]
PAVDNLEPLLFLVRGMLDRLGARLEAGGHAATSVRLRLELEDPGPGEPAAVDVLHHLRAPASGAEDLWIPVSALIRRQRLRRAVSRVALRVSGFCPAGSRQMDLLARRDNRLEDIARQLAVITEDLGPGVVRIAEVAGFPSLLDERRHRWLDPAPAPSRKPPPRRGQRPP